MVTVRNSMAKLALAALAMSMLSANALFAKKPAPPPPTPPPPGTIHFDVDGQPWAMDGAGQNKVQVPVNEQLGDYPSSRIYGNGYRWSLIAKQTNWYTWDQGGQPIQGAHNDLFAVRSNGSGGFVEVQITDMYGQYSFSSEPYSHSWAAWSNDGQDSFFSCRAIDVSSDFVDAKTPMHIDNLKGGIIRFNLSGAALEAEVANPTMLPLVSEDELLGLWAWIVVDGNLSEANFHHSWSPSGNQLAFTLKSNGYDGGEYLYMQDLSSGVRTLLFAAANRDYINNPSWRPGGNVVAFRSTDYSYNILEVVANGTTLPSTRVLIASTTRALWSPDGNHLIYKVVKAKGRNDSYELMRLNYATGVVTNLTSDLNRTSIKHPIVWLPN